MTTPSAEAMERARKAVLMPDREWDFQEGPDKAALVNTVALALDAFAAAARADERTNALAVIKEWSSAGHMRLHAGELSTQEVRTVQAVLSAIDAAIRSQQP